MRADDVLDLESYRIRDHDNVSDDIDAVIKTIIMKVGDDYMTFVVPLDHLVDYDKIRRHFDVDSARLANEDEVIDVSGSKPGGCCPLLCSGPIYVDRCVLEFDMVHMGSGEIGTGLEMETATLLDRISYDVLDVSVAK
jgi:prolyl-tRNA editing enzyme YbaK/EbsC (Cys-tRNA(Pro) deacylase)